MRLRPTETGFALRINEVEVSMPFEHQEAQKSQRENIVRQLTKLGDTPYECNEVDLPAEFNYFIPSSRLAELRRMAVDTLMQVSLKKDKPNALTKKAVPSLRVPDYQQPYLYNISNELSSAFYKACGMRSDAHAFELCPPRNPLVMQCRYCLRYELGYCVKHGGKTPRWHEPLFLKLGDGRRFRLEFDCRHCQMNIYGTEA